MFIAMMPCAEAQVIANTPQGIVIAHDGRIEMPGRWSVDGVANATAIATAPDRVAVLDAMANAAVVVDLQTGRATKTRTLETPIAAAFAGSDLYILSRDARALQRGDTRIPVAADPAFLRAARGRLYVYSRAAGVLQEIDLGRVTKKVAVPPFASDLEISGTTAYLVYPRDARVRTVDLSTMKIAGEITVGGVPADLAFAGGGTALTARLLAVADPSSKRIWIVETSQSTGKAVARGVVRGLLGLGLYGEKSAQFPTGIDRIETNAHGGVAYDSSSGTLYRFTGKQSSVVAAGVAPGAFTLTPDGVAWWSGTSVAQTKFR